MRTACHSSSISTCECNCQSRSQTPATNATTPNANHPQARRSRSVTGNAGFNMRRSACARQRIRTGLQAQRCVRREKARAREPPLPEPIDDAGPQHAEAVDDRAAEVDLARFGKIARRARDLADAHAE